ncbi:peptide deformylase [bacterium]|nr:peptide deformylase [bacterium]
MDLTTYPNPTLRKKSEPVVEITDEVIERVKGMFATMYETNGVGLAAPQVGWNVRLCVINPTPDDPSNEFVCVNPVITEMGGDLVAEEGCLSLPDVHGNVRRHENVTCKYYDLDGNLHEVQATGLLSRIFQHELDHLDGRMIIDRMTPASRLGVKGQLKDLEREYKTR